MFQSIIPPEALEYTSELPTAELCACVHGKLEGHRDGKGSFVVARLISTDPAAYLDARYAPGSVVKM